MTVRCPNCRRPRVRVRRDGTLTDHLTPYQAPCRLAGKQPT